MCLDLGCSHRNRVKFIRGPSMKHHLCMLKEVEFHHEEIHEQIYKHTHARTHACTHTPEALLRDAAPRAPRGAVLDSLLSSLVRYLLGVGGRPSYLGTEGMGGERTPLFCATPLDKDTSSSPALGRVGICSSAPRRRGRLRQNETRCPIRSHRLRLPARDRQLLWPGQCCRAGAAKGLEPTTRTRLTR